MAPAVAPHHHRSTTKASHKPFKSRHATKGFLKDLSKGTSLAASSRIMLSGYQGGLMVIVESEVQKPFTNRLCPRLIGDIKLDKDNKQNT
jgi:hypothetical protein